MGQVYEESVYQDEAAVLNETALTPQDQLRLQWQQQPGAIPFIRQKNLLDQHAELVAYAKTAPPSGRKRSLPPRKRRSGEFPIPPSPVSSCTFQMFRLRGSRLWRH